MKKILFSDFFRRKKSTASILDNIIIEAQCEFKVNSTSKCKNFLEYIVINRKIISKFEDIKSILSAMRFQSTLEVNKHTHEKI
jgi:hypothetical protein